MTFSHHTVRRDFLKLAGAGIAGAVFSPISDLCAQVPGPDRNASFDNLRRVSITDFGAVGDGATRSTEKIQAGIDRLAAKGGGTLVIPPGVFVSGAIFLKPGVNLHLEEGAVLKGSTNIAHYPKRATRIEGQFVDWIPALVNADKCDHLRISGTGTLDGSGQAFYTAFWDARKSNPKVTNLAVERPRLAFLQNSTDVRVSGVRFKNSGFWNLHLYRCSDVAVENVSFESPHGQRPEAGPSTDGIDIDSCQRVTVRSCVFAVNDDCVCLKGTKGPLALQDKNSPPTEHICVTGCTFRAGHGVVTCGSEASVIRDVVVEDCRITGKIPLVRLKFRPDTPQHYEDIHYRNITLVGNEDSLSKGEIFDARPWKQFFDLKGQQPPKSVVRNVTLTDIKGSFDSFGEIQGNPGQTEISGITLKNIDVQLKDERLTVGDVANLKIENVTVNGKPLQLTHTMSSRA
jgi:alpha-L-rhamnosidase